MLAEVEYGGVLLGQITSKTYGDRNAVPVDQADFKSGSLPLANFARPGRILTAADALIVRTIGELEEANGRKSSPPLRRCPPETTPFFSRQRRYRSRN